MGFIVSAAKSVVGGALGLLGVRTRRQAPQVIQPNRVTRDDAQAEAQRERELARRRGARADREDGGGGGGGFGGFGRFVPGA